MIFSWNGGRYKCSAGRGKLELFQCFVAYLAVIFKNRNEQQTIKFLQKRVFPIELIGKHVLLAYTALNVAENEQCSVGTRAPEKMSKLPRPLRKLSKKSSRLSKNPSLPDFVFLDRTIKSTPQRFLIGRSR